MEYSLAALNVFMTPRQLHLLTDVASSLSDAGSHVTISVQTIYWPTKIKMTFYCFFSIENPLDHLHLIAACFYMMISKGYN